MMSQAAQHRPAALLETAALSGEEAAALTRVYTGQRRYLRAADRAALDRLLGPVETITAGWRRTHGAAARNGVLAAVHHTQSGYWAWDEDTWAGLVASTRGDLCHAYQVIAIGYLLGGQHRLHHRFTDVRVRKLADLVFGPASVQPAVDEVSSTLHGWQVSPRTPSDQIEAATIDVLLTCGSPHLTDVTEDGFTAALNASRSVPFRRQGLFKVSRVLADKGLIAAPLTSNHDKRGPKPATLATVPGPWLAWVLRWRRLCTNEPATVASMFSVILIAGRWAAAKHPEAITPPDWNRDLAAEYVADTMQATVGQWASHPGTKTRLGQPLTAAGKANRLDGLRSFFCDLIEWEWITPRFDPRRVLSLPGPLRAQLGPNPRIIDDAAWAKLMAAGLTLTDADLTPDMAPARDPSPHAAGRRRKRYPVEMTRALVGAWLFAGCRIDELRAGWSWTASYGIKATTSTPDAPTRSVCCGCLRTRPPGRSASPSTPSSAISSTHGNRSGQPSPTLPTARPGCDANTCSATAASSSAMPTSTPPSSRCCAARPASPRPTPAAP